MLQYISGIAICILIFCLSMSVFEIVNSDELKIRKNLNEYFKQNQQVISREKGNDRKGRLKINIFSGEQGQKMKATFAEELYAAGINLRPEELFLILILVGVVIPVFLAIVGVNYITCVAIAVIGVAAPLLFIKFKKNKMYNKFDEQLVDAIGIMVNSLKAGFPIQLAISNIAKEMQDPISREFKLVERECSYGLSIEEALENLSVRVKNDDLMLVVNAINIQREVGGNLADVLSNISSTIQARIKMKGDIKVMTAAGKLGGIVVGCIPIVLLLVLMILNPTYIGGLLHTRMGHIMLIVAAVMEALGFLAVKKIVDIKF